MLTDFELWDNYPCGNFFCIIQYRIFQSSREAKLGMWILAITKIRIKKNHLRSCCPYEWTATSFPVQSFSEPRCSQLQRKRWFTHWLAKPCFALWPQHLNNSNSVSDTGPQAVALMDCNKHEPWNTQIGSDTTFLSLLAFLDVKELWKDNLSQIFMAELMFFTIQSCCHFWFQTFSLLHFHLKKTRMVYFFPDCPIRGFLGNVSSSLNTYTICSLDLLSVLTKLYFPFAHL